MKLFSDVSIRVQAWSCWRSAWGLWVGGGDECRFWLCWLQGADQEAAGVKRQPSFADGCLHLLHLARLAVTKLMQRPAVVETGAPNTE